MATKKIHYKLNHIKDICDGYLLDYGVDIYDEDDGDMYEGIDWYWYYDYIDNPNRIREEKIDQLFNITTDATFYDILPESLKNL